MIIKSDSKEAKLIKSLLNFSYTKGVNTVVEKTIFSKDCVCFVFDSSNSINNIRLNIDCDEDFCVSGKHFVEVLAKVLSESDAEIKSIKNSVIINGIFEISKDEKPSLPILPKNGAVISFTKEQYEKLEKDFSYSSTCFESPKIYNTITFGIRQGNVYKYCPNTNCVKISTFDANIDNVSFEKNFGHSDKIVIFPKAVYDMFKDAETVKVEIFSSGEYIVTDGTIIVKSLSMFFGVNGFIDRLNKINNKFNKNLQSLCLLKDFIKNFKSFEESDDSYINISTEKNKTSVKYGYNDNFVKFNIEHKFNENFTIITYLGTLLILLDAIDEDTEFYVEDSFLIVKNGNDYYFSKFSKEF